MSYIFMQLYNEKYKKQTNGYNSKLLTKETVKIHNMNLKENKIKRIFIENNRHLILSQ